MTNLTYLGSIFTALLLALSTSACSSFHTAKDYNSHGMNDREFNKTFAKCELEGRKIAAVIPNDGWVTPVSKGNDIIETCMKAEGFEKN